MNEVMILALWLLEFDILMYVYNLITVSNQNWSATKFPKLQLENFDTSLTLNVLVQIYQRYLISIKYLIKSNIWIRYLK